MKAFVSNRYGGPSVMVLQDVIKPTPKPNEVLIKVKATSVNPYDWHFLTGKPYFMRLISGLIRPKNTILGADLSGVVEAVGQEVEDFQPGDEVYGDAGHGAYAEYVCTQPERIVHKPENLSLENAASVSLASLTAYVALKECGLNPGDRVLINGGAGGVGTFCVQMAKASGADVTAVCSTRNVEMVRSLGADRVIDYSQSDFINEQAKYDVIIDNVGNKQVKDLKACVNENGRIKVVGYSSFGKLLKDQIEIATQRKSDNKACVFFEFETGKRAHVKNSGNDSQQADQTGH